MSEPIIVAGLGMIPFSKSGASPSYTDMGGIAVAEAVLDYDKIQQAYVGHVHGMRGV